MTLPLGEGALGLCAATFAVCAVSGILPLVNAELYLLGAAALATRALLPALTVCAAAGQMVAKMVLYLAGRGLLRLPVGRFRDKVDKARARAQSWGRAPLWIVFASASVGLPPFYVVSVAAGWVGVGPVAFGVVGFAGRALRFGAVLWLGERIF